jgi:glucosyl-3-phosphoglycerate synthase
MNRQPMPTRVRKVLIPVGLKDTGDKTLEIAEKIADDVVLVGIAPIAEGGSVSAGVNMARQVRKRLHALVKKPIRSKSKVIVSPKPWKDLQEVIRQEEPDLLLMEWGGGAGVCGISVSESLSSMICNVAIIRPGTPFNLDKVLVTVRGGPYAELALRLGMKIKSSQLDVLHLSLRKQSDDAAFEGLKRILLELPEANLRTLVVNDVIEAIYQESGKYGLVILGTTSGSRSGQPGVGMVAEKLLKQSNATVLVVKTQHQIPESMYDERAGSHAISILVDKWFAENTYSSEEFEDLDYLLDLKKEQGAVISLALPALNEEPTVGKVISTAKESLMEQVPLLDEIVLVDSDSKDRTREIAQSLGIPVYIHQKILPETGARHGKGEALWKSLYVTHGDIVVWLDTDIVNVHPRFIYGVLGPLLLDPGIQFVKGFFRRPIKIGNKMHASGGGRVTELTARPLLNLFYPELSGVIQPLSGEYAGRRKALEEATFFSGYGVEIGLLIDMLERHGLRSIAQVDLKECVHHNQDLEALSKMSFVIIQTVLHKLEGRFERNIIEEINKTMKFIRYNKDDYYLELEEVAEKERPPMNSLEAYRKRAA